MPENILRIVVLNTLARRPRDMASTSSAEYPGIAPHFSRQATSAT